ncbi:MAG: EAL domain-containing protein [Lachnospiraceae bacterium]|nr:EAL domain-containing protein [Lachnospiraceae bacterium]
MDALMLDVNHFHMINERYGKSYGDTILRRIGERVRKISREIGGIGCHKAADTFLIYCPHKEDYTELLEKASAGLAGDSGSATRVRLRLGVYPEVDKKIDIERRFDRAKIASDSVRGGFAGTIGVYDVEMGNQALLKEKMLEEFHSSIKDKRFKVYFQPKFDIRHDSPILSSAEALVRWDHPELGMISPGVFIPLFEDNGLIFELDMFVWNEAASKVREWKDRIGFAVPVSVNVSRVDMLNPNLKNIFQEILDRYSLTTDDMILELTESAYTGDSEQVISTARELRGMGMGFRIEMDDFGTGYSSLGMLMNLPIDALKLDMTFVRSAFGETKDVRMIELIIDIADYLHVPVVAEGVETEEQYLVLKAMGCDLVQGYYFSKPVPVEEFEDFLIKRKSQSAEMIPAIRKTYMSLSKALTSDFESIFFVDVLTDYYLEFFAGPDGELQIRPGGQDFFGDVEEKLLCGIEETDLSVVRGALQKENVVKWIGREASEILSFKKCENGVETVYSLQTIRTRNNDDHHIVIGVRREE